MKPAMTVREAVTQAVSLHAGDCWRSFLGRRTKYQRAVHNNPHPGVTMDRLELVRAAARMRGGSVVNYVRVIEAIT